MAAAARHVGPGRRHTGGSERGATMQNTTRVSRDRCSLRIAFTVLGGWLLLAGGARAATPIAQGSPTSLPAYVGAPASPKRIPAHRPPRNPGPAKNGRSNVHDDSWMSDA